MKPSAQNRFQNFAGKQWSYAIIVLGLVVILSSVYNLVQLQETISKNNTDKLVHESDVIEKDVTRWISEDLNGLSMVKDILDNLTYVDLSYQKTLNKYLKLDFHHRVMDALYIGVEDGVFLSATDWTPPKTYDPRKRSWYVNARKENGSVLGDLYIDADTEKYIFTMSTPFETADRVKGVIGIDIYLDSLATRLKSIVSGTDFDIAIFDGNGLVVHYTGDAYLTGHRVEDFPNSKLYNIYQDHLKTPLKSEKDVIVDEKGVMTFSQVPNSMWTLAILMNKSNGLANTNKGIQQHYFINALLVILSLAVIYRFYKMDDMLKRNQSELASKIEELDQAHEVIKKSREQKEHKSFTDSLTHVFNRTYFDDTLEKYWTQAISETKNIGIAMIDVDYFKKYNEHFGHVAGDQMLIKLSREMSNHLDAKFVLSRYGGEAFAVLAYDVDEAAFLEAAKRLKEAVYACRFSHEYSEHHYVTISIGVNIFSPTEEESMGSFIHKADQALYEAKLSGRNKVLLYNELK